MKESLKRGEWKLRRQHHNTISKKSGKLKNFISEGKKKLENSM